MVQKNELKTRTHQLLNAAGISDVEIARLTVGEITKIAKVEKAYGRRA